MCAFSFSSNIVREDIVNNITPIICESVLDNITPSAVDISDIATRSNSSSELDPFEFEYMFTIRL